MSICASLPVRARMLCTNKGTNKVLNIVNEETLRNGIKLV